MNVFPTRPEFNVIVFGVFAAVLFIINVILSYLWASWWIFTFLFFLFLFMILNPYLIYYGLKPKKYCPNCHSKCSEEPNREYEPFGPKRGEGLPHLPYEESISHPNKVLSTIGWYCPYCGASISRKWKFCKLCGKILEINL